MMEHRMTEQTSVLLVVTIIVENDAWLCTLLELINNVSTHIRSYVVNNYVHYDARTDQ